jgi:molybdate transport system substrate-binding protein
MPTNVKQVAAGVLFAAIMGSSHLASAAAGQAGANPPELTVMLSPGFAGAYDVLIPQFERAEGVRILTVRGGSTGNGQTAIPGRLSRGEPADVVIVADEGIQEMEAAGTVIPSSRVGLASTGVGMAVAAGRPRPDISTPDALRQSLLDAEAVAYSTGPSGTHVSSVVLPRLGIVDEVTAKAFITVAVPAALTAGEAEIGFQQVSELVPAAGIDFVAPLPDELQLVTFYSAAIAARSTRLELAAKLIAFLTSPEVGPVLDRTGLQRLD